MVMECSNIRTKYQFHTDSSSAYWENGLKTCTASSYSKKKSPQAPSIAEPSYREHVLRNSPALLCSWHVSSRTVLIEQFVFTHVFRQQPPLPHRLSTLRPKPNFFLPY